MVRIFIGNPHRDFIVKRIGLEQSALLRDSIKYQSGEAYIMSPVLADLLPDDFESVAEYLDHGEYKPNLLNEGSDYARLENVEDNPDQKFEAILQCGQLYTTSGRLELPGLQDLVIRKFKTLRPYAAEDFLLITKLFYCFGQPADRGLHDFIVNYAAEHFYKLWDKASKTFKELLEFHTSLARDIFRELVGLPKEEEVEIKAEAVGEEEDENTDRFKEVRDNRLKIKAEAKGPIILD
ncbi:hypothetical protein MMC17_008752 [Xylographa soralifera]|nr:hypothetical protein [Xylographa soralifera]